MKKNTGIPEQVVNHLETYNNTLILEKELRAYESLSTAFDSELVIEAMNYIRFSGIPPYGKLCLYPLTEINENRDLLNFFSKADTGLKRERPFQPSI